MRYQPNRFGGDVDVVMHLRRNVNVVNLDEKLVVLVNQIPKIWEGLGRNFRIQCLK